MITKEDILNAHILIVDDLEVNVALLEDLLGEAGYQHIASTMDPYAVTELHRANNYDLILLDLQMPGMDGFEVIADLKSKEGNDYLPILVITAQPAHKLRALDLGAKDFISKPFDIVEVKTRIRNMLEVRLLYKQLHNHNQLLEERVLERTAQLRESKARYRSLIELAADWYWEQDEKGTFTRLYGPVQQMLGIQSDSLASNNSDIAQTVWNEVERSELQTKIASRQPFLDFVISCTNAKGSQQKFQVSGEPMFNQSSRFIGYRGFGVELSLKSKLADLSQ
jgi:PAS domain S-box-containing protein